MKKTIKILMSILLLALLSVSLVGCKQLDDLKRNHGVYLDASKEEIELRGHVYEKVAERVLRTSTEGETYLIADEWSMVVTEKDVPVLLASSYGETIRYNSREEEDPVILSVYDGRELGSVEVFYCRSDYLETLKAKRKSVVLDHFYYTKMMYSEAEDKMVNKKKMVSEEATEVIKKTLTRPYDPSIDLDAQTAYLDFSEYHDLRYTDEDLLFTNDINLEVCKTNTGQYYVFGASSSELPLTDQQYWKRVAPEENALLDEIFPSVVETFVPDEVELFD